MLEKKILAFFGALGSISPDILLLYSKRWTMPELSFVPWQFIFVTGLYMSLAAIVAVIFPYRGKVTSWKAMAVGFALPIILSAMATVPKGHIVSPRGTDLTGTLLDIIALF